MGPVGQRSEQSRGRKMRKSREEKFMGPVERKDSERGEREGGKKCEEGKE